MFELVNALSAFTTHVSGVQMPTLEHAQDFQKRRHIELNEARTSKRVLAEVSLYLGAANRFVPCIGGAIVHFRAAYEGFHTFEHPDNARMVALCAWALAESFIYEAKLDEAKTWYWKALALYTKVDGLGACTTRSCLKEFQHQVATILQSRILYSHLNGIERLSVGVKHLG